MFALGDKEWPGLSKLSEECGEVVQVIGKLMGTRGGVDHWDGTNLKHRLEDEIADVMAAAQFVIRYCGLEDKTIEHRIMKKLVTFETWHHEGDPPKKGRF